MMRALALVALLPFVAFAAEQPSWVNMLVSQVRAACADVESVEVHMLDHGWTTTVNFKPHASEACRKAAYDAVYTFKPPEEKKASEP